MVLKCESIIKTMKNKFEKFKEEEKVTSVSTHKNYPKGRTEKHVKNKADSSENNGKPTPQRPKGFSTDKNREGFCKILTKILEDEQTEKSLIKDEEYMRNLVVEIEEGKSKISPAILRTFFRAFQKKQMQGGCYIQRRRKNTLHEFEGRIEFT